MLCQRCSRREATGTISSGWRSSDGAEGHSSEQVCAACCEADRAAGASRGEAVRAALADGSYFARIRDEVSAAERAGDAEAIARVVGFVDVLRAKLELAVPADLLAWADRHRRPAA